MSTILIDPRTKATETLSVLADIFDQNLALDDVDMEADAESLALEFPRGGQILLTYHGVAKQLWLSSPWSGAHHFSYTDDEEWMCTRSQRPLKVVLSQDIAHFINRPFEL